MRGWRRARAIAFRLLKVALTVGLVAYLYRLLFVVNDVSQLYMATREGLHPRFWLLLLLIASLVPLNLVLEAQKFRVLMQGVGLALPAATRRVCAGIAAGIWTPNRVGEYAGRLVGAGPGERTRTVTATLLGGVAQWVPLAVGGVFGAFLVGDGAGVAETGTLLAAGGIGAVIIVLYLTLESAVRWALRWSASYVAREGYFSTAFAKTGGRLVLLVEDDVLSPRNLGSVLLLSSARYGIYLVQISLAYLAFGLDVPAVTLVAGVAVLLLVQSFMPVPSAVQMLARAELSLLIWASYTPNPLAVTAASLLILVLNLGMPAFVGLAIILRAR